MEVRLASLPLKTQLLATVAQQVLHWQKHHLQPRLDVVLVGGNPASKIYVSMKGKTAQSVGIDFHLHHLPEHTTPAALYATLDRLNADPAIHGILLQLPLPPQFDRLAALNRITPAKDVDGLTDASLLALEHNRPGLRPCTPLGIMRLLAWADVPLRGANAVVVGRSRIVGKPVATMLDQADATVSICHSKTMDLPAHLRQADVVIAAAGVPQLITGDMLKPGAVVIDVGINSYVDSQGVSRLRGDCDYASCASVAKYITPVPGGVGPMTVTSLMTNLLAAVVQQHPDHPPYPPLLDIVSP